MFVNNVLEKAWIRHVAAQIHRSNFDIESFDAQACARCVKKRSRRQQGILMTLACGKHVTMDALVHYSQRVESKQCPFCTEEDSKEHRLCHCPEFADLRKQYAHVMRWMRRQKRAIWAFAHFPDVGKPLLLKERLQVDRPLILPPREDVVAHVYTDGSAFYGDSWDCCLAGSAVVRWCPDENQMREIVR